MLLLLEPGRCSSSPIPHPVPGPAETRAAGCCSAPRSRGRAGGCQSCGEDERATCTSASTPIPAMPNRSCTHLPLATLFARTHLLRRHESCRPSFCLYTATRTHTSILVSVLPHMRRRRRIHLSYNQSIDRSLMHHSHYKDYQKLTPIHHQGFASTEARYHL